MMQDVILDNLHKIPQMSLRLKDLRSIYSTLLLRHLSLHILLSGYNVPLASSLRHRTIPLQTMASKSTGTMLLKSFLQLIRVSPMPVSLYQPNPLAFTPERPLHKAVPQECSRTTSLQFKPFVPNQLQERTSFILPCMALEAGLYLKRKDWASWSVVPSKRTRWRVPYNAISKSQEPGHWTVPKVAKC